MLGGVGLIALYAVIWKNQAAQIRQEEPNRYRPLKLVVFRGISVGVLLVLAGIFMTYIFIVRK